ncbi:toll-like receptor 6 [Artemia franciscana]|uniref:toll-like receptor 6 n=1 Tax=Artemia franciscana TaxID=6661 RepID=UPI0032DAD24E
MIDSESFRELSLLESLDLSYNNITGADSILFDSLANLKVLNLSHNYLQEIDSTSLDKLLIFDLTDNKIRTLTENSFRKLYRLLVLRLSGNALTDIDQGVFRNLRSLQILHLDSNKIERIPSGSFNGLTNLHILSLSGNRLGKLEVASFEGLRVLNALRLDFNHISYIHPDSFRSLTSLQKLVLYGNRLKDIPTSLKTLVRLKTLDLGSNKFEELRNNSFSGLSALHTVKLGENLLHEIEAGAFKNLRSLKVLNLARNALYYLENRVFESVPGLEALNLEGNQITSLNGLFKPLHNLTWLNISDNQIDSFDYSYIPPKLFGLDMKHNNIPTLDNSYNVEHNRLEYLDVSHNRITMISPFSVPKSIRTFIAVNNHISKVEQHTFADKKFLKLVNLQRNLIRGLEPASLRIHPEASHSQFFIASNPFNCDCRMEWLLHVNGSSLYPLVADYYGIECITKGGLMPLISKESFLCEYISHCFALCHCCDFEACDCEMSCPVNCTCAHDSSWTSNIVDCSFRSHKFVPSGIPMDATEVRLDGNNIEHLLGRSFLGRKNMLRLFLNSTGTVVIPRNIFSGLKKLVELHLENNLITRLNGYEFESLECLESLHLQFNRIEYIETSSFSRLPNLKSLNLHGNKIRQFSFWELSKSNILEIQIHNNPWSCECSFMTEFQIWIAQNNVKIGDVSEVLCLKDTTEYISWNNTCLNNDDVSFISILKLVRKYSLLLFGLIALTGLLLFLILLALCNRQSLYYKIYGLTGYRISKCKKCSQQNKMFDVFINYSVKDESLVYEELKELNESCYRVCMQHRELNVGVIGESVYMAGNTSKIIMIILTNNYIQSEWYRPGIKSMLLEMSLKHPHRIIVLVIEEVRDSDSDLRKLLRTVPIIISEDKWKWSKLRYYLPQGGRGRAAVSPFHSQPLPISMGHYEDLNKHIYSTLERIRT